MPRDTDLVYHDVDTKGCHWQVVRDLDYKPPVRCGLVGSILRVKYIGCLFKVILYVEVWYLNDYQRSEDKWQSLIVEKESPNPKP